MPGRSKERESHRIKDFKNNSNLLSQKGQNQCEQHEPKKKHFFQGGFRPDLGFSCNNAILMHNHKAVDVFYELCKIQRLIRFGR